MNRYCEQCGKVLLSRHKAEKCASCGKENPEVPLFFRIHPISIAFIFLVAMPLTVEIFGDGSGTDGDFSTKWLLFFGGGIVFSILTEVHSRLLARK